MYIWLPLPKLIKKERPRNDRMVLCKIKKNGLIFGIVFHFYRDMLSRVDFRNK